MLSASNEKENEIKKKTKKNSKDTNVEKRKKVYIYIYGILSDWRFDILKLELTKRDATGDETGPRPDVIRHACASQKKQKKIRGQSRGIDIDSGDI